MDLGAYSQGSSAAGYASRALNASLTEEGTGTSIYPAVARNLQSKKVGTTKRP